MSSTSENIVSSSSMKQENQLIDLKRGHNHILSAIANEVKVKPKTMFMKMFYKLPQEARKELIFDAYGKNPMTLNVIALEARNDTKLSKKILDKLGYKATADNKG